MAARYAPVYELIRAAAVNGDPEIQKLWATEEEQRLVGARHWLDTMLHKPGPPLRDTPRATIDTLWLYMAPDHYPRLVTDRGWATKRYQAWLTAVISNLFEPPDSVTSPPHA